MRRHRVPGTSRRRAEQIRLAIRHKPTSNRILLNIQNTVHKLLFRHDLAFVEAAHPHILFALQPERKASLYKLHCLFERNVRSRRNKRVEMVRHDDECVQKKSPLIAIVEERLLKQLSVRRHLEEASSLRRYSGHKIRTSFLRSDPHYGSIYEMPVAKANLLEACVQGPEGPCSLRWARVGCRFWNSGHRKQGPGLKALRTAA